MITTAISSGDSIPQNSYNEVVGKQADLSIQNQRMSETQTEAWTNQRLLQWTTEFFKGKELDSPRLSAEVLLAAALDCERIDLYARFNEVPVEPNLGTYRGWVKRHGVGEPVAYLVGHKEFYSLKFHVNSDVLIPRPETEHLIMAAVDCAKAFSDSVRIVDVGTGSGCIAVTLAKHINSATITAVDISSAALDVASSNVELHQVGDQVELMESDLLEAVPDDHPFEIIVSNPPYVGRNETGTLQKSVGEYEPELALYGGDTGTEIIERLIEQAAKYLYPSGFLILEFSPMIAEQCEQLIHSNGCFESCKVEKDYSGMQRFLIARKNA